MTPKVIHGQRPPNYADIVEVFPEARRAEVIFAYGHEIYTLSRTPLSSALMAHETVHCERQLHLGVLEWWRLYLTDRRFMFEEEVLAHRAEYHHAIAGMGRQVRKQTLNLIAKRLASPLYGRACTLEGAKALISA